MKLDFTKAIPLINSTCNTYTNNCVAYLADICDIILKYLSTFLSHKLDINGLIPIIFINFNPCSVTRMSHFYPCFVTNI